MKNFDSKIATLITTTDGGKFCDTLAFLNKRQGDLEAEQYIQFVQALIASAANGPVTFHRDYALSAAIELLESGSGNFADELFMLLNSGDSSVEYWAVAAYAKSVGKNCYDELVEFII